jgi:hypothetical protein
MTEDAANALECAGMRWKTQLYAAECEAKRVTGHHQAGRLQAGSADVDVLDAVDRLVVVKVLVGWDHQQRVVRHQPFSMLDCLLHQPLHSRWAVGVVGSVWVFVVFVCLLVCAYVWVCVWVCVLGFAVCSLGV